MQIAMNNDYEIYENYNKRYCLQEKHRMTFNFDPLTGTPIKAYKKIQFNVIIGPIPKLRLMKSFPEALFPLFWVEDGLELGNILIKPLKVAYLQILIAK